MKKWPILLVIISIGVIVYVIISPLRGEIAVSRLIQAGNKSFEAEDLTQAMDYYSQAEALKAEDQRIVYNMGLTALKSGDYDRAIECLDKIEMAYLELGNAYYYRGKDSEEPQMQMEDYEQALKRYRLGIVKDSTDLELKYNYELVAQLVKDLENQQEQENQENQQNQESESQDNQESDQGESSDNVGGEEQQDGTEQDGEESQEQQGSESQEGQTETGESSDETEGDSASSTTNQEAVDPSDQALQYILQLLEQQEADSLKNNQGILVSGKEDGNDW